MTAEFEDQNRVALDFYEKNYRIVGQWMLDPDKEQFLGDSNSKKCRFCDRGEPEATFETLAHAIPESIGNKSLFSYYECDDCNARFGRGIEREFGNWSNPIRAMTRIKGKKGVPVVEKQGKLGWRVETDEQGDLRMEMKEAAPIFSVDEEKKQITFNLTRGDYTPAAVLKTFVKIAFTLLPQMHLFYFSNLREWMNEPDHSKGEVKIPVMYTFQPGPLPNDKLMVMILIRKQDYFPVPYVFLVIAYGNEMFQIQIPSSREPSTAKYEVPFFPNAMTPEFVTAYGKAKRTLLDLSGTGKVKAETYPFTASYAEFIQKPVTASPDGDVGS